jgi:hypothetical protein
MDDVRGIRSEFVPNNLENILFSPCPGDAILENYQKFDEFVIFQFSIAQRPHPFIL